jgi:hypothetical protein
MVFRRWIGNGEVPNNLKAQGHSLQYMVHRRIYTISSNKASPRRLMNSLHWKAHMSIGAQRCAHSTMAAMWSHGGGAERVSVHALTHVIELDLKANDCPSNGLHLYSLIEVHATNWVIACSLI